MHISSLPASPTPAKLEKPAGDEGLDKNRSKSDVPANNGEGKEYSEQRQLQTLKSRDRAVRAHELAHQAVGGRYVTRGARFDYERGPDGRQYAVSGDVRIDSSAIPGDPIATLQKARVVQRAALAPVNPSSTDRQVAARAVALMQQARIEMAVATSDTRNNPGSRFDSFA